MIYFDRKGKLPVKLNLSTLTKNNKKDPKSFILLYNNLIKKTLFETNLLG